MKSVVEIDSAGQCRDLVARILSGEVVVLRRDLRQIGVHQTLVDATLDAIGAAVGSDVADRIRTHGFERLHDWVKPADIPRMTDAVYARLTSLSQPVLASLVPRYFPEGGAYYFERSPNVRFHIPFDLTVEHRGRFDRFAKKRGDGKVTAHGPHRDPWLDCPANAINIWIALGPVERSNGLTIFKDDYRTPLTFDRGYLSREFALRKPLTFELRPGDAVLFHAIICMVQCSTPPTARAMS